MHECFQPSHWSNCWASLGSVVNRWWTSDGIRKLKSPMKGRALPGEELVWGTIVTVGEVFFRPHLFPVSTLLAVPPRPLQLPPAHSGRLPHPVATVSVLPLLTYPSAAPVFEEGLAWLPDDLTYRRCQRLGAWVCSGVYFNEWVSDPKKWPGDGDWGEEGRWWLLKRVP